MQIGSTPRREPEGITELLLACHERIRTFAALAIRLGEARELPADQVRDAAHRVRRYFAEALPLHVEDEEHTVLPRLRGRSPELDAALARMHHEHAEHGPQLTTLVATCEALEAAPERFEELRGILHETATALQREFEAHLHLEETVIVPAIARWLPAGEQAEMLAELRARRG